LANGKDEEMIQAKYASLSRGEVFVAKVIIILFVFPALMQVLSIFASFPLFALLSLLSLDGQTFHAFMGFSISLVNTLATIVAVVGAFSICRKVWPRTPKQDDVSFVDQKMDHQR
jgi:hypothetical protein